MNDASRIPESVARTFRALAPAVDHCAIRIVAERARTTSVRQDVAEPPRADDDLGAMITVIEGDGIGYAGTSDLSRAGLAHAIERATGWARASRGRSVFDGVPPHFAPPAGRHATSAPALDWSVRERIDALLAESRACRIDARVVDWEAHLHTLEVEQLLATADGAESHASHAFTVPGLQVTAHADGRTQTRSFGGQYNGFCQQGGRDVLERAGFVGSGRRTAEQAVELLDAPNCPTGTLDVILMPDQMMLQIHESIGHPLELDRILGDERNYAGTSFVTLDMFGTYRYGSPLLDVTADPTRPEEFASFGADDEATPARREYLIRGGILLRPLGGASSAGRAARLGHRFAPLATTRAASWNRPPIDRMANLNVEPGDASLDAMIAAVEDGVLMETNVSWSIDDSRNKFQFGCERGRRIRNGRLAEVVRNPGYRGVSATFWRSLAMVGDASTMAVMGTPFCGKGEPNQVIRVGHASPACLFRGVEVFGAES